MSDHLPLPTLLSCALVAFTIEFDNESEHRMRFRTTTHKPTIGLHAPWLVSMAMYLNCMQFADEEGITVRELVRRAHTKTNFRGMHHWGYISVKPDPSDKRTKQSRADKLVRATPAGLKAKEMWRPLLKEIESRWQARFGDEEIRHLRESLVELERQFSLVLPDCLPILGYGLGSDVLDYKRHPIPLNPSSDLPLPVLLSRVLLAFAHEFEQDSQFSVAISANLLRVLDEKGTRLRDLPRLTGVSKEAISMAMGILTKAKAIVMEDAATARRGKVVRLTPKGQEAKKEYEQRLHQIEKRWKEKFGSKTVSTLLSSLEPLVGDGRAQSSPLFQGLEPYPDGWRAAVPKLETLPHYPMVLHRGGFPDGS